MNEDLISLNQDYDQLLTLKARKDILAFTLATKEDYSINWHHKELARKLNAFARGEIRFLMVFMPPRHGKSELVSRRFPAFLHGLYPDAEIMAASYLDSLAGDMCIDVQNIIDSPKYKKIFPDTKIYPWGTKYTIGTRNSSEHHIVGRRGKYRGQGVGGSFTGKGANYILIDDPIKGREVADSATFRDRLWSFYNNDLFSRLETDLSSGRLGQVLITQCMTGDTLVLMADGTELPLRNIKIGDTIVTYDDGLMSTSTVKNWKSQGLDYTFKIKTSSGITVRANERHPFLVFRNGITEWVRLRDLRVNDKMIRVGVSGKASYAHPLNAKCQQNAKDFACLTTINSNGSLGTDLHPLIQKPEERHILDSDTELTYKSTIQSSIVREQSVAYANFPQAKPTHPLIGSKDFASTTIIRQERSEDCFVTHAIYSLNTATPNKFYNQQLSIYEITFDCIVDIEKSGYEEVFDIQVDRTENFIANGLVSHNTRWHEDDLSGRLLELQDKNPKAIKWDVLNYPAIRVNMDTPSDPRSIGDALWPDKYNLIQLEQIKSSIGERAWGSLYQQNPVPNGGAMFKDTMFEYVDLPKEFDWTFVTADTAYKEKQENDFNVFSSWGVSDGSLFLRDIWKAQIKASDVEVPAESFIRAQMDYGYRGTWIEPKGHGIYLNQAFLKKGLLIPSDDDIAEFYKDRRHDKVERASNVTPHLSSRKIYINKMISLKEELVSECLGFPKVKHDDFVDTLVDALKMVYARKMTLFDLL